MEFEHLAEVESRPDDRADDRDPIETVSKIGSSMWFSAGSPTNTSVPPRRSERYACSKGFGAAASDCRICAAESLNLSGRVGRRRVDRELGTELSRELELVVVDVDSNDARSRDPRVLQGQAPQPADAEHGDEVGRLRAGELDPL
jgi:hypothetical protein